MSDLLEFPETKFTDDNSDHARYPSKKRLTLIFAVFSLSLFLVTLDQTIVATAIPTIASHFNSFDQVAWIPGAYFLTQAGLVLVAGQILTIAPTKTVYLSAVGLFELGSLICGVSNSMPLLIFGRAVAGMGAAALFPAVNVLLVEITPLKDRALLIGILGMNTSLGVIFGPLLGGAFTDKVSWRWCFYINLPLGAIAITTIWFFLHVNPQTQGATLREAFTRLDIGGSILSISLSACLLLPLQWGGNTKPWNSPAVIGLLCTFGVLLLIFIFWERRRGEHATLPLSLMQTRSLIGATLQAFFIGLGIYMDVYYIPLWYQVQGHSATRSGVDLLPFLLTTLLVAGVSGAAINHFGRYWHVIVITPLLFSVGSGLLFTLQPDSPGIRLAGYQIISGIGIGGSLQNVFLIVHAKWNTSPEKLSQASATVNCFQLVGGLMGIAIAGTLFANQLSANIAALHLPAELATALHESVATIFQLPEELKGTVVDAYVRSLDKVFLIGVPAGFLASVCGLLIEDFNIKTLNAVIAPV